MDNIELVKKVIEKYQLKVNNINLICTAFIHSSYVNEHKKMRLHDNERLEFLGDSVLGVLVSHYLFSSKNIFSEGEMTKLRSQYVCEGTLYQFAKTLGIGELMLLGHGEEITGGRLRPAVLADAFEAFLGALYVDSGLENPKKIIDQVVIPYIENGELLSIEDYKSELQEFVQADNKHSVHYEIVDDEGPAHNKIFTAEVYLDDIRLGRGTGRTKKEAEQNAAKEAMEIMAKSK